MVHSGLMACKTVAVPELCSEGREATGTVLVDGFSTASVLVITESFQIYDSCDYCFIHCQLCPQILDVWVVAPKSVTISIVVCLICASQSVNSIRF